MTAVSTVTAELSPQPQILASWCFAKQHSPTPTQVVPTDFLQHWKGKSTLLSWQAKRRTQEEEEMLLRTDKSFCLKREQNLGYKLPESGPDADRGHPQPPRHGAQLLLFCNILHGRSRIWCFDAWSFQTRGEGVYVFKGLTSNLLIWKYIKLSLNLQNNDSHECIPQITSNQNTLQPHNRLLTLRKRRKNPRTLQTLRGIINQFPVTSWGILAWQRRLCLWGKGSLLLSPLHRLWKTYYTNNTYQWGERNQVVLWQLISIATNSLQIWLYS